MVTITGDSPAEQQREGDDEAAGAGLSTSPIAKSFGDDPAHYDRARPRYPRELIDRVLDGLPGRSVLDAGCGTGIVARQLQAAGCEVLGVEPDPRMAAFAEARGVAVEIAKIEDWEPAGRTFDALVAGMTWHWVDAARGAAQAVRVLRPGGRIALFWNAFQLPTDLAESFAAVYARRLPDQPMYQHGLRAGRDVYAPLLTSTADVLRDTGAFEEADQWRFDWQQRYTRDTWVDLAPTFGGHALLPKATVAELMAEVGAEVDKAGGSFVAEYTTVAVTALRKDN
ncbi:class I SAM-dependent methyltransferase [Catenulispora yoronensis]|uniref:Class I SAM-dependent methyltransferase n=1 Tax=Catenulispora yoronensis TaxID=450799 RepID=A0ABP5GS14_9ACTN